ncbi:MAG: magnesium transporter CorA family protein [Bacteroidales bacterium]|nr:magnesium transporter CorA family protein [Bacteroidales bacterium]
MIETVKLGTLRWNHINHPVEADFDYLQSKYHVHLLDIEDCKSKINQRPKVDSYDDYYFLILHFPIFDKLGKFLRTKEVKIFWWEEQIITIGSSNWIVGKMFQEAQDQENRGEKFEVGTTDALLYLIIEAVMKESYPVVRRIGDDVDRANRELFEKKAEKVIERISITRKNIIILNTIIKPQLRIFLKFEKGDIEGFAENMEDYWGNILDNYQKMWDMIEDYQELIEGLSRTFDSLMANRTNEVMRILTLISSIILPLTFITGIYGMNINLPMQHMGLAFSIIFGTMITIAIVMVLYFKKKRWM